MESTVEVSPQDLINKFRSKQDLYNRLTKDCIIMAHNNF